MVSVCFVICYPWIICLSLLLPSMLLHFSWVGLLHESSSAWSQVLHLWLSTLVVENAGVNATLSVFTPRSGFGVSLSSSYSISQQLIRWSECTEVNQLDFALHDQVHCEWFFRSQRKITYRQTFPVREWTCDWLCSCGPLRSPISWMTLPCSHFQERSSFSVDQRRSLQ